MTQVYPAVYKKSRTAPLLLSLLLLIYSPFLLADDEKIVKPFAVPNPAADLWRAVRQGQEGFVSNPAKNRAQLIVGIPPGDCNIQGNCTELAVGFSLPVHDLVPAIIEKRGVGISTPTMSFILFLFGGLAIAGLVFVIKLTRARGESDTAEGEAK